MQHYAHLSQAEINRYFYIPPRTLNNKFEPIEQLARSLGATLYMPATRADFAIEILEKKHVSLTSMVLDLEDAVSDDKVEDAIENFLQQMAVLNQAVQSGEASLSDFPLLFLRVRNESMLESFARHAGLDSILSLLTGFVLPKATTSFIRNASRIVRDLSRIYDTPLYLMPILEGGEVIYAEYRKETLDELYNEILLQRDLILNIRLGGTDFSGLFGLRRPIDTTVYDLLVVRDCIADILNKFLRASSPFIVSGVVWEYFGNHNRMLKPQLRETPFIEMNGDEGLEERDEILNEAIDGLIREVILDKTNGILGKTIIHPQHIRYVNALQVVTMEEYLDAKMVLDGEQGGVSKSLNNNKMNESKPHLAWAKNVIAKSKVYGVLNDEYSFHVLF